MVKFLLAAVAALGLSSPLAAQAQEAPSYAQQPAPSYASQDQAIHGRVVSFDGSYDLAVRDDRGYVDHVRMHQGTIINPTGLTLAPGMVVSIDGYNAGAYFSATEIDTPYTYYEGVPYYYGHPWFYYGPSVSLGFFFGGGPGWHHGWGR
ncbi:MAG TPA: hypothetical protein VME66_03380 [Candidatus Acidoferrales bacterium]|nr:hypothetical protein [Candidatus Acidoferrales bacterium]